MENQEKEFNLEELENIIGGYKIQDPEGHPFKESDMYREKHKKILEEIKEELQSLEEKNNGRSR